MAAAPMSKLGWDPAPAPVPLDLWVDVPSGRHLLGERGQEREVELAGFRIGRYPVTVAQYEGFLHARDPGGSAGGGPLSGHPATGVTYADAEAFCDWVGAALGEPVRLPSGDEWEAAARGGDGRDWPWGGTFDPDRCNCVEAAWGWTVPVDAHPAAASPCGAEQMAGNVWEWVSDLTAGGAWRSVRGGSYLDHAWGVRSARSLDADPERATPTTGFRLVNERRSDARR